jgi:hypothetical protein
MALTSPFDARSVDGADTDPNVLTPDIGLQVSNRSRGERARSSATSNVVALDVGVRGLPLP